MRNTLLFGFVLTLLLGACKEERRLAIEGSWRMVYGEWTDWKLTEKYCMEKYVRLR